MSSIIQFPHDKIEDAFPKADPGASPFGARVLIQLRSPKTMTDSGIALAAETQDQEAWVTTIGKVISLGPLAFKDRTNIDKSWPEGQWAKPGDFVRCPKHGGDRWIIALPGKSNYDRNAGARFVIYRDSELIALVTGDPLSFIDYI